MILDIACSDLTTSLAGVCNSGFTDFYLPRMAQREPLTTNASNIFKYLFHSGKV